MPAFLKTKKSYFYFISLLIVFLSILIFKDRLFLGLVKLGFKKAFVHSAFDASSLTVWPGYIEVKGFGIRQTTGGIETFKAGGGQARIRFSTFLLFKNPVLAVKEGDCFIKDIRLGESTVNGVSFRALKNASGDYLDSVLEIENASFKKGKGRDFKGIFRLGRDFILFDEISGSLLGGGISSTGRLVFGKKAWALDSKVHFEKIELRELLKAFQAEKGVKTSGSFSGDVRIVLENGYLRDLSGRLDSVAGGDFIITDTSLLGNNLMGGQAANIVVENLKNYHYDIGNIQINKEGQDIRMTILLEGKAGSRDFKVIWHREEMKK